jgi:hypothetical protein
MSEEKKPAPTEEQIKKDPWVMFNDFFNNWWQLTERIDKLESEVAELKAK